MINVTSETKLDGIAQHLPKISLQLASLYDLAIDLEIKAEWYDVLDSQSGGPPITKNELRKTAQKLRQIYLQIAVITGLDPCEQFEDTKLRRIQSCKNISR